MALGDTAGILFKIKADSSQATREMQTFEAAIKGTSASSAAALGSLAIPAAAAAAAIASIGVVAVRVASAMFDLTKASAEYGSQIYDAGQKTGLTATTLTALKFAAEQSGSSFEQVTKGVVVFGAEVGKAAQNNVQAQEKMKLLGVTSTDLNTALGQVFKTINNGRTDTEKLALASEAFGRRIGPDLIPLIKEANGDLEKLIATAKKLGITLTEEDVKAADEFGDTLGLLGTQAEALAAQFTLSFAPEISRAMQSVSRALGDNQSATREWGNYVAEILRGLQSAFSFYFSDTALGFYTWASNIVKAIDPPIIGLTHLLSILQAIGAAQRANDPLTAQIGGTALPAGTAPPNVINVPRANVGRISLPKDTSAQDAERAERDRIAAAEQLYRDQTEYFETEAKKRYAIAVQYADQEGKTEEDLARFKEFLDEEVLEFRKSKLEAYIAALKEQPGHLKEIEAAQQDITIIELKQEQARAEHATNEQTRDKGKLSALMAEAAEVVRLMELEAEQEAARRARELNLPGTYDRPEPPALPDLTLGQDALGQSADWLNELPLDVLDQFAQGIGNVVQNMILLGTAGPNAMRKLTASVLAGVAAQAAVLAIKHFAMGIAALTPWGAAEYGPAPAQFLAAAKFAAIAGIAAGAGRAIAGDSFQRQSSQATGQGGGTGPNGEQRNNLTTQFRGYRGEEGGQGFYDVFRKLHDALERNTMATAQSEQTSNHLATRIEGVSPGEIVTLGAPSAATAIQRSIINELADNPSSTGAYRRNMGDAR